MAKNQQLPVKFVAGFMTTMDGRTDLCKRLKHTFQSIIDDAGGMNRLPYTKICLCERFAFLEEFMRQIELQLVEYPEKLPDLLAKWVQTLNAMHSLARTLGIGEKRSEKDLDILYEDCPDDDEVVPY